MASTQVLGTCRVGSSPAIPIFVKNNRQKRQTPKLGMGWCDGCDREVVPYYGKKCPNCGYKNKVFRLKKEKFD